MSRGIFLQTRLDSSRLPRKALLDLGGKPVVALAMEALARVPAEFRWLLTDPDSERELRPVAEACGFGVMVGPRDDVLRRFALAIEQTGVETILRATGDNPLVSSELANSLRETHIAGGYDYSGYLHIPLGTGVEAIRASALLEADAQATDPYEREHVAPYLYRRPHVYRVGRPTAPSETLFSEGRVTLDTPEDYLFLQELFADLYHGEPITTAEVATWLHAWARRNWHGLDRRANALHSVRP